MTASTHIIIVNYNAGDWLARSIDSALAHSQGVVTVVDNDSSDQSALKLKETLEGESRINWIFNQSNKGFAAANNQVLSQLDQEFAVLMNPDCELNEHTLPLMLEAFAKEPDMGLASCRILNEDGSLQVTCRRRFPTPWSALVRMLQLHRIFPSNPKFANFDYGDEIGQSEAVEFIEAVSGAFMMVRKSALNEVGLLDEAYFMHCEDLDWCKRFAQSNWKVGFVAAASVVHAKGVSSRSRPVAVLWTLHRGMNRFFDKFYRNEYSWLTRYTVKFGIALSFIGRSFLAMVKGR